MQTVSIHRIKVKENQMKAKRQNLRATMCPVCGKSFTKDDIVYPGKSFETTFGYREPNFYGGNVDKFCVVMCCRKYYLYLKVEQPFMRIVDIEPLDYEQMMTDMNDPDYIPINRIDHHELSWQKLKPYAVEMGFPMKVDSKKEEILEWLDEHSG